MKLTRFVLIHILGFVFGAPDISHSPMLPTVPALQGPSNTTYTLTSLHYVDYQGTTGPTSPMNMIMILLDVWDSTIQADAFENLDTTTPYGTDACIIFWQLIRYTLTTTTSITLTVRLTLSKQNIMLLVPLYRTSATDMRHMTTNS